MAKHCHDSRQFPCSGLQPSHSRGDINGRLELTPSSPFNPAHYKVPLLTLKDYSLSRDYLCYLTDMLLREEMTTNVMAVKRKMAFR